MSHRSFQSWTTRCLTICVFVLDGTWYFLVELSWVCNLLCTLTKSNGEGLILLIVIIEGLRSLELIVHHFVALVCQFFQTSCVVGCTDWLTWLTAFNDLTNFLVVIILVYEGDNRFLTIFNVVDWCILSWITWNWWWVVTLAWIARIFRCQWCCAIWAYWCSAWYMWNHWKISTWFAWICWIVWIWKVWYFWKSVWYIWYIWTKFAVLNCFFAILIIRSDCLRCDIGLICHESSYDWCSFLGQFFRSWCPCSEGLLVSYTVALTCTCEGCFLSNRSFQSWTTRCLTICVLILDGTCNLAVQISWIRIVIQAWCYNNCPSLVFCLIVIELLTIWLSKAIAHKLVTCLLKLSETIYSWVSYWFTWLTSNRICIKSLNWNAILTICYVLDRTTLFIQVVVDNFNWISCSRINSYTWNFWFVWAIACNSRSVYFWKVSIWFIPSTRSFHACYLVNRNWTSEWCCLSNCLRKRWASCCYTVTILVLDSSSNIFLLLFCFNNWSNDNFPYLVFCLIVIKLLTIWLSEAITYKFVTCLLKLSDTVSSWINNIFTWFTCNTVSIKSLRWNTVLSICYILNDTTLIILAVAYYFIFVRRCWSNSCSWNTWFVWGETSNCWRINLWKFFTWLVPLTRSFNTCHLVHRNWASKCCCLSNWARKCWTTRGHSILVLVTNVTSNIFRFLFCLNTWSKNNFPCLIYIVVAVKSLTASFSKAVANKIITQLFKFVDFRSCCIVYRRIWFTSYVVCVKGLSRHTVFTICTVNDASFLSCSWIAYNFTPTWICWSNRGWIYTWFVRCKACHFWAINRSNILTARCPVTVCLLTSYWIFWHLTSKLNCLFNWLW